MSDRPSAPRPKSPPDTTLPRTVPEGDISARIVDAWRRHHEVLASARSQGTYAEGLVQLVRELSGCACVGLRRVRPSGFLPFLASIGFPAAFRVAEDCVAYPAEDCACIRILAGRDLPSWLGPVEGDGDSRACGDLAAARETPDLRRAFPPRCLDAGFRTFALFPARNAGGVQALIQVADRRPSALSATAARVVASLVPLVVDALRCLDAEDALDSQRSGNLALAQALPLPLWIVDADHRIWFQNPAHVTTFGQAEPGALCHKFMWNRDEPCLTCSHELVLSGETTRDAWKAPRTGRIYDVLGVPLDLPDRRAKLEILLDATDRLQAESLLRQTQRMESLGSLAAGIAHDFNNILAGVSGYAQLGEQGAADRPGSLEAFRQVRALADRGAELTRKILAFSRHQPMQVVPLDLNDLVKSMQPMLMPLAGDLVDVRLDLANGLWAVLGDRSPLEQALFNLCANAVEAMSAGGTLTITTANVEPETIAHILARERAMSGVVLKVTDTGCGMSRDIADRIFEPFFTTKGRGRGTGLGLSVTYGIVRQLGGAVTVDTAVGRGTTMAVYLPSTSVTPSRAARPRGQAEVPPCRFKGRAMVVEDETAIRDLVAAMLARMGFEVVRSPTADEALPQILASVHGFDLLVSDVSMPGMNGCELVRRVQSLRPSTAVLLMTGCSDDHLDQYGLSDTMPVLHKPFDLDELAARVEELVSLAPEA